MALALAVEELPEDGRRRVWGEDEDDGEAEADEEADEAEETRAEEEEEERDASAREAEEDGDYWGREAGEEGLELVPAPSYAYQDHYPGPSGTVSDPRAAGQLGRQTGANRNYTGHKVRERGAGCCGRGEARRAVEAAQTPLLVELD